MRADLGRVEPDRVDGRSLYHVGTMSTASRGLQRVAAAGQPIRCRDHARPYLRRKGSPPLKPARGSGC
jgi:hypothetical protein